MISAVQHAKRNALKSSSKITMVGFAVLGGVFGTECGVMLGGTFQINQSLWQSPAVLPLVVGTLLLMGIVWFSAKK